jgi:hypothetical protein
LKALSQSGNPSPLVRALTFAQKYTASIPWGNLEAARAELQGTNAFMDATEAENSGIRLTLPQNTA